MSNCRGIMAVAVSSDYRKRHTAVAHIRCKLWSCSHCAVENRKQWRAVLYKRLPEISPQWSFHTFTTGSHKNLTIDQSESVIMAGWEKLIKRLRRLYGKFSYVRTIELHQSGHPHIHALFSLSIPDTAWVKTKITKQNKTGGYWYSPTISAHLADCGFGVIQSSENLPVLTDSGLFQALGYATKYMTKRVQHPTHRFSLRFIQTSRDIKLRNLGKSAFTWTLKSGIYEDEVLEKRHIDISRNNKRVTCDDFEQSFIYPSELLWADWL